MNMKLALHTDITKGLNREITYLSYLREDFVDRVLRMLISPEGHLISVFFSSNTYGTCSWEPESGITDVHRWEDEDSAQDISNLSRHYTTLLLNGKMPREYGQTIIDDVLAGLTDTALKERLEDIILHSAAPTLDI